LTVPAGAAAALRLHLNENTGGCSPAVLDALRSIGREDTAFYPDYTSATAAAARYFGVDPDWVQLTNGLDEGLHVVAQAVARDTNGPGRANAVVIVDPAFEMYDACAEAAGLPTRHIAPVADFRFPTAAVLEALPDVGLVYLTDPNNPTGLPIPSGVIEQIAQAAPHALVLADEAYAEFSGRTVIGGALDRARNLIVGRTFAKAHGLAALRIGAVVAHPDRLAPLRRILPPYNVNVCAVRALEAALADPAHLAWYVEQSAGSRRLIYAYCERAGLHAWPSEANFVLIRVGADASAVVRALAGRGILIRDRSGAPGCAGCIRITAGIVDHTRRCLDALEDVRARA
jgi:histidinol-phosphate aminotransferase